MRERREALELRGVIQTFILEGVEARICTVEAVVLDRRTPRTTVVGLPDA